MECTLDKKLQGFQLIAQEKLQAIICSIPGKKDLILEQSLIKPLEHICAASWLKLKGIQRIYKFDVNNVILRGPEQVQVFMIRSQLITFQRLLRHIHELELKQPTDIDEAIKNFHIICIPACFSYFQSLLEEEGLYGLVQLHRYNWDFIYMDQGVLSMEVPNVFASLYLREDTSFLPSIAQTLRILQMICRTPDLIVTFGDHAANIVKMFHTLGLPNNANVVGGGDNSAANLTTLIIIDRDKDYASSLLTPAIYAGLLMEVFTSRAGEITLETETNKILQQKLQILQIPKELQQQQHQQQQQQHANKEREKQTTISNSNIKPPRIHLNSLNDEIYGENRYKHFAQASSLIRAQAKAIGLEVHKLNDMKLDEMHDYVARKLPKITELKQKVMRHLNASEKVIQMLGANYPRIQALEGDILNNVSHKRALNEIDELLTTDGQKYNTLRLLCLLHLCAGISAEELAQFVRNYCNYFGAQHLSVFQQLARAGLLPDLPEDEKVNKSAKLLSNLPLPKFQQTEFQANANRLKLMVSTSGTDATPNAKASNDNSSTSSTDSSCPSYVFNSLYIPLVAQLCSFILKSTNAEDFATKVGMVDKLQLYMRKTTTNTYATPLSAKAYANSIKQSPESRDFFPLRRRKLFVYLVGGVTYAEIGACDLIARQLDAEIIVASDSIVSGADLIADAFL